MIRMHKSELVTAPVELRPYLNRTIDGPNGDLNWIYEYMRPPVCGPYAHIKDLLTEEALSLLNSLPIPENGKCNPESVSEHPVAGPLVLMMAKISLMNRLNHPDALKVRASLKNETAIDRCLPKHRDFLDGHAVLFNWCVKGELTYIVGDDKVSLDSNELIVLNGSADHVNISGLTPSDAQYGFASPVHGVEGKGSTSRNRLLVYADGVETNTTQIAA